MVRDLCAHSRTPSGRAGSGNDENEPAGTDAASRPPIPAIQAPPAPAPATASSSSGVKRKAEPAAQTPSKKAARTRFGCFNNLLPRCATPYSATASEGGSAQTMPTKSVAKPAYAAAGTSGSTPPPVSAGSGGAGFSAGTAGRDAHLSLGPTTVVNTAEVPHFELREDPSFWMENNVQLKRISQELEKCGSDLQICLESNKKLTRVIADLQRNSSFQNLQNKLYKLLDEKHCCEIRVLILQEKLEMAQARAEESEAIATESRQIAEERKIYAEEKDEEVKRLKKSVEELERTVCALENKVEIIKEEGKQHRMQREELEVELQKVRQKMLAVPPFERSWSSVEAEAAILGGSSRHPRDLNNELLGAQERIRILQKKVSENETEIAQCKASIHLKEKELAGRDRELAERIQQHDKMAERLAKEGAELEAASRSLKELQNTRTVETQLVWDFVGRAEGMLMKLGFSPVRPVNPEPKL